MLSHDNITWTCQIIQQHYGWTFDELIMSYLPMSHIAALMNDNYMLFHTGGAVAYADKEALRGSLVGSHKHTSTPIQRKNIHLHSFNVQKNQSSLVLCQKSS